MDPVGSGLRLVRDDMNMNLSIGATLPQLFYLRSL